jgi:hypothetical protein
MQGVLSEVWGFQHVGCAGGRRALHYCYCYYYMVQDLPEHPVGSQRGSWGTSVIVRI